MSKSQTGFVRIPDPLGQNISCHAYIKDHLRVLFDPLEPHPDGLWKHASVSIHHRYPTWDEILDVRYTFFDEDDEVFQVLPPKSEYVNLHPNCFHLWCKVGQRLTPG